MINKNAGKNGLKGNFAFELYFSFFCLFFPTFLSHQACVSVMLL